MISDDCQYPNCVSCTREDCNKENKDITAMLKRRRWALNPTLYRQKQRDYRAKIKESLPHCDECENCILVEKENRGYQRLCIDRMKLVKQETANSPHWCGKRKGRQGESKAK